MHCIKSGIMSHVAMYSPQALDLDMLLNVSLVISEAIDLMLIFLLLSLQIENFLCCLRQEYPLGIEKSLA